MSILKIKLKDGKFSQFRYILSSISVNKIKDYDERIAQNDRRQPFWSPFVFCGRGRGPLWASSPIAKLLVFIIGRLKEQARWYVPQPMLIYVSS